MSDAGTGPFENATAQRWLVELQKGGTVSPIFAAVVAHDNLEGAPYSAELAQRCVAAGEVLAALMGRPSFDFPTAARDWVKSNPITVQYEVLEMAILAVRAALTSERSELRQRWSSHPDRPAWEFEMTELLRRLGTRG